MFSTVQADGGAAGGGAKLNRAGVAFIFFTLGPLAFAAPRGMWIPPLLLLLVSWKRLKSVAAKDYRQFMGRNAVFLTLSFYACLSAAWAAFPGDAFATGAKQAVYWLAAVLVVMAADRLRDGEKRSALCWAGVGLVVADLLVWVDLGTAGAVSTVIGRVPYTANLYSLGAVISAVAFLPITVGLGRLVRWPLVLVFAASMLATVFVLDNHASKLAVVLGSLVYAGVSWRRGLFQPVIVLLLAACIAMPLFFAPALGNSQLCTVYNIKPSAAHRLMIYHFSSTKISERPILGWGMDASRTIPGGRGMARIFDCAYKGGPSITQKLGGLMPLHPHNASLQVWLELGGVGVVIFAGLLGTLVFRWQRGFPPRPGRPLIAGMLTTISVVYNIGFGLWQAWLIFSLISICALSRVVPVAAGSRPGGASSG
jgi:exopolysaccharide production protein ExoQ